jgi:outer membrane receptor protein involved in Fe transport
MKPPTHRLHPRFLHLPALATALGLITIARAGGTASPDPGAPTAADPDASHDVVTLETVNVTDAQNSNTTLPERPVTGVYGFATSYQDIPRSIAQLTPEQFANDTIQSVDDFANYTPSTSLLTGAAANSGTPYFRGSQGDLYQNGVRLLTRGTNNRPFTLNPYEQADLVAGPAPVIFGPSARTAGYVNYITKQPFFDEERAKLTLNIGSWYGDGTGTKPQETAQLDVGGPIIRNALAYRVSYEGSSTDSFYENTRDRYNNVFAALGWRPDSTTALDFNLEFGHYDWIVNNGQNRVTNDLIRNGTYLAGPSTPIIQVGTSYYSPVLDTTGQPTGGWIHRTKVTAASGLTYYQAGTATTDPTGNTTAGAGTVVGYVLDPTLVQPTPLSRTAALNAPNFPSLTTTFNFQSRFTKTLSPSLTLYNTLTGSRYFTDSSSNGGFYNYIVANSIEDRFEVRQHFSYRLFGLNVDHDSNSGVAYRWEPSINFKDTESAPYGPTGDFYNLAGDPNGWTRDAFFGAQVYPFTGLATTPISTKFGYLKGFWQYLPVPQSTIGGATTPGGSASGTAVGTLGTADYATLDQWASVFTQQSIKLGSHFIWDFGGRLSLAWGSLWNPLPSPNVPGNNAIGGAVRVAEPSGSTSFSYKPVPWLTAYVTYDHVVAVNGNTSGVAAWSTTVAGVPNQLDPYNFKSPSDLKEAGAKAELIPGKLFGTIAAYRQTRDLTLTLPAGAANTANPIQAVGLYEGGELGLRFQPTPNFSVGANYSYLEATNLNSTYSAPAPLVADNATNILGATTSVQGVNYRMVNLPHDSGSLYATYAWRSGFGVRTDLWVRGSYWVTTNGAVTVPAEYDVDVGLFYAQPRYRIALNLGNVTNQRDHDGGGYPLPGTNAQVRFTYQL